jgi:multiple antibiotic resistance protein
MNEHVVGAAEIFTLIFITLGPLKILGPFLQRTHDLGDAEVRQIAIWSFVIATISAVAGSALGRVLAANWHVSIATLSITAGVIFFLVALKQLLAGYEPPHPAVAPPPLPPKPVAAAATILFPVVLTPYGIAAVIVLLASNREAERIGLIMGLLVLVMVLNLLAMLYARRILTGLTIIVLQILGAILGVLQVGLAIEFIVFGLRGVGALGPGPP